jgi:aminomethyltransferase
MTERGIPRHGYELATPDGEVMGVVTSGTMSPMLKEGIGLGYVRPEYAAPGTEIAVIIRDKPVKAVVIKLPFV